MKFLGLGVPELTIIAFAMLVPIGIPLLVMGVNWKHGKDIALKRGAFAGMVTALVCNVVYIIPLAWMIPMMVVGKGVMDGRKANTVAYGVCTLLFVNLASGVMLLCAEKQDKAAFRAADHLDHPACGAPQQQPQVNISNYYIDGKPANPGNQGWND